MAIKLKKMYSANIDKANGMIIMIEKSIQNLEGAQINKNVYDVLKEGDTVLREL